MKNEEQKINKPQGNEVLLCITRIISGCSYCPMCDRNDMDSGYSCRLKEHPINFIYQSKKYQPITPQWCPIKKNDILFKYGH